MSEDKAFIRKIVDSPGDDLPRLVYADWLDERDDPRGAYLRAEAEWAKTKQTTGFLVLRLHGLAEGLDPVWVARVSRPPEGVCCDQLARAKAERWVEPPELVWAGGELKQPLPPQLQAVVLNYNPGRLPLPFYLPTADPPARHLNEMANLDGQADDEYEIGPDLVERTWWLRQELEFPDHLLFLAGGTRDEHYVVSADEADAGRVYAVWDADAFLHEHDEPAEPLADSVGRFLARLEPRTYPLPDSN